MKYKTIRLPSSTTAVPAIRNALSLAAMYYGLMNLWIEADKTQGHRLTNTF